MALLGAGVVCAQVDLHAKPMKWNITESGNQKYLAEYIFFYVLSVYSCNVTFLPLRASFFHVCEVEGSGLI